MLPKILSLGIFFTFHLVAMEQPVVASSISEHTLTDEAIFQSIQELIKAPYAAIKNRFACFDQESCKRYKATLTKNYQVLAPTISKSWNQKSGVYEITFIPPGTNSVIATFYDERILRIWDISDSPVLQRELKVPFAGEFSTLVSPDGHYLALCKANDENVYLWDLKKPNSGAKRLTNCKENHAIVFSRSGKKLLTISSNNKIFQWNLDQSPITSSVVFVAKEGLLAHAEFDKNDDFLAVVSTNAKEISIWINATKSWLNLGILSKFVSTPECAAIIAVNSDGAFYLDLESVPPIRRAMKRPASAIIGAVNSHDGKRILLLGSERAAELWDFNKPNPVCVLLYSNKNIIDSGAFCPNGRLLLTSAMPNEVKLWDVSHEEPKSHLLKHSSHVASEGFSDDGRLLLTGTVEGALCLWDLKGEQEKLDLADFILLLKLIKEPDSIKNDGAAKNRLNELARELYPTHQQNAKEIDAFLTGLPLADKECIICTELFNSFDTKRAKLPCCKKFICSVCVARTLSGEGKCPFCKRIIGESGKVVVQSPHRCNQCFKSDCSLRCSQCQQTYYCSQACQTKHWATGHGVECKKLPK